MGLGTITPNVFPESTPLLGGQAFQIAQSSGTPIEQPQPDQITNVQNQTDSVEISSTALALSKKSKG